MAAFLLHSINVRLCCIVEEILKCAIEEILLPNNAVSLRNKHTADKLEIMQNEKEIKMNAGSFLLAKKIKKTLKNERIKSRMYATSDVCIKKYHLAMNELSALSEKVTWTR